MMRVVSLLPSATEALCTAGGEALLVGRSHECDYPASIVERAVPMLTAQKTIFTTAKDVDNQVRHALQSGESLYTINEEKLAALEPDVILTQSLCSVCSIDLEEVNKVAAKLPKQPKIVSLNPYSLEEVMDSIVLVGQAVGLKEEAIKAQSILKGRIDKAVQAVKKLEEKTPLNVAFVEWSDPIYVGGHWTPQLIEMAGGTQEVNPDGGKSFAIAPERLVLSDPDRIIICPCGLDLEMTEKMVSEFERTEWWPKLRAVKSNNVALVDGNQMFNRPGPRLVDCLEWLSVWLHGPDAVGNMNHILETFPWKPYTLPSSINVKDLENQHQSELLEIEEAHTLAMSQGKKTYTDPKTGYSVFTAQAALDRGYCCGRACRHCPYGHFNVPADQRSFKSPDPIREPRLLLQGKRKRTLPEIKRLKVVFWSGGKDSFLTYLATQKSLGEDEHLVLLNSFDNQVNIVQEQNIPIEAVMDQAQALGEDLILVPLAKASANNAYVDAVRGAIELLKSRFNVATCDIVLVFGDLHLADIRDWRQATFSDYTCEFPLFNIPYEDLAQRLFKEDNAKITVSAANHESISVGENYDFSYFKQLESLEKIDAFGENGEFHTHVQLQKYIR